MFPSRDWSCSGDAVTWHGLREAARYVLYDEALPLRISLEKLNGLVTMWMGTPDAISQPERLEPGSPCPVGEAFLLLLHFVMSGFPRIKNNQDLDSWYLSRVLMYLENHVPIGAAFQSSWPLFGLFALAQQEFLGIGGATTIPSYVDLSVARSVPTCRSGEPLIASINQWLADSTFSTDLAPSFAVMLAARSFKRHLRSEPEECRGDHVAWPMIRLIEAFMRNGSNFTNGEWPAGLLDAAVEKALRGVGWRFSFFSAWPMLAVLHRLQEAIFRDAFCADAEEASYGILSRAEPQSVWICVTRGHDVVDERWRQQGTFEDCTHIAHAMKLLPMRNDRLFIDIGANLGFCTLMLTTLGLTQKAIAFEPVPSVARRLRAAVFRNRLRDSVTVFESAVGSADVGGSLHCQDGHSSTCYVVAASSSETAANVRSVRTVSLDSVLEAHPFAHQLFAVKVDVEGAEEEALLGAARHLTAIRPCLFIEIHPLQLRKRGSSPARVINLLVQFGYIRFEALSVEGAPYCKDDASLNGQGVYPGARWRSSDIALAVTRMPGPCACATACFANLMSRRCRCWDFDTASGMCLLKRQCGSAEISETDAPSQDLELFDTWWAGEANGNWFVSNVID